MSPEGAKNVSWPWLSPLRASGHEVVWLWHFLVVNLYIYIYIMYVYIYSYNFKSIVRNNFWSSEFSKIFKKYLRTNSFLVKLQAIKKTNFEKHLEVTASESRSYMRFATCVHYSLWLLFSESLISLGQLTFFSVSIGK